MVSRPLHIGIDGRELIGQRTGVGRYLERVLQCWTGTPDWPHRLTIFVHDDPPPMLTAVPGVVWHVDRAHGGTIWEQTRLPRAIESTGVDVLFAVGYTAPMRMRCPFVVVIHDVSFIAHPEWFHWREGLRRRWFTKHAALRAAWVLTVSNFSADEIVRTLGTPREKIRLAPPGAPEAKAPPTGGSSSLVLYVGSILNRRHVPELIEGFAGVARERRDARLVLVGANRSQPLIDPRTVADTLGIGDSVDWREYVDDEELSRLYGSARVFAFLSEYEGFGMTPMEALAEGVPPLLLDSPVAREIYGDAAVRVPLNRAEITGALIRLLDDDAARAGVLSAREELFTRFSWQRTADTIRKTLEEAAHTT